MNAIPAPEWLVSGSRAGKCQTPMNSVSIAQAASPSGRVASYEIDIYPRCKSQNRDSLITLCEFIDEIRSEKHVDAIAEIRRLRKEGIDNSRQKHNLPAATLSAKNQSPDPFIPTSSIQDALRQMYSRKLENHTGLLQVDLDASLNPKLNVDTMRQILLADPHIVAIFMSPSGDGMKGVCRIPADATRHRESCLAAKSHYVELGLCIDLCVMNPLQYCTVSHDPNAVIRDGIELPVPDEVDLQMRNLNVRNAAIAEALGSNYVRRN